MARIYSSASKWTGEIGTGGVSNDSVTTIPLASASGLTESAYYVFSIDRVDANSTKTPTKWEECLGQLSGTNFIGCTRGTAGTAQAHSAGAVVEVLFSSKHWEELKTYLEVEHGTDGTHSSATVTTLKASGAVVNTGESDVTIVTPKALADSDYKKNPMTAAGDIIYGGASGAPTRLAKGTASQVLAMNSGVTAPEWVTPTNYMVLLKANSGTSTEAGAENVDTIAMASGLTAKDTLIVYVNAGSATQQTASLQLYNSTDGVAVTDSHTIAGGNRSMFTATIQPDPTDTKDAISLETGAWNDDFTANAIANSTFANKVDFTTDWTGAWTLALRHNGVTAGGTFRWSWAVYKIKGQ